jgi:formylglycine-generating enzyme required for sulfatase activity
MKPANLLILFFLAALALSGCGGQDQSAPSQASTPTASASPTNTAQGAESNPQPTEIEPVKYEPQHGDTRTYVDGTRLVYIPAGEFNMGIKDGEDNPIHAVFTNGFWIYSTEVTNDQYALCVAAGFCSAAQETKLLFPSDPLKGVRPVVNVTHPQARAYCQWVNGRLPTEAEWEKAARAPEGKDYPWGDEQPACDRANFGDCQTFSTTPATAYPDGQTPYRMFDMAGNAYEWVSDWYADDYYPTSPFENPAGPVNGEFRSIRGGSYLSSAEEITTFARSQHDPDDTRQDIGFRCVIEMQDVDTFAPMCVQLSTTDGIQQPSIQCPEVSVATGSFCQNGLAYISHTHSTEPGYQVLTPSLGNINGMGKDEFNAMWQKCQFTEFDGNGYKRVCQGPEGTSFQVRTNAQCKIIDVENSCGENYEYDPNQQACVYKHEENKEDYGTSCPAGFNYNPDTQCCTAAQEVSIPLTCQPGFVYDPNSQQCIGVKEWVYVNSDFALAAFPFCSIQNIPTPTPKSPEPEPTCDPATGAGCTGTPSDSRLKTDIVRVGETESGLPLYTFRYLGGTTIYRGVMAQDVLTFMPEAVVLMPNGYWAVNYDMLGLAMEIVDWPFDPAAEIKRLCFE